MMFLFRCVTEFVTYLRDFNLHCVWASSVNLLPNWCIDNPSFGALEMMLGLTRDGHLCNVITHKVIWVNQKTELLVYRLPSAHAAFDVTCFHAFVWASNIIISVQLINFFSGSLCRNDCIYCREKIG